MTDVRTTVPMCESCPPQVSVGRYTYGKPRYFYFLPTERIKIGSFCSIAEEVVIFGGGEHNSQWISTYPFRVVFDLPGSNEDGHPATKGPTVIGNDVWIGFGATILSGVKIGNGAIIGARAVVTKDVEPYSIVAGNPAKLIRHRFDESQRRALEELAWWDWPIEEILSKVDLLCSGNVRELLKDA